MTIDTPSHSGSRNGSKAIALAEMLQMVKQQNMLGLNPYSSSFGPDFDAALLNSGHLGCRESDRLLHMLLIERDCRSLSFDDASLVLAQRLSEATDDEEIQQLVYDCYKELCTRTYKDPTYFVDIDSEMMIAVEMVVYTPIGDPNRLELLRMLGFMFQRRYKFAHSGKPSDLNIAINCYYQIILLAGFNDPSALATDMLYLGDLCNIRFECTKQLADVDQAITCLRYLASGRIQMDSEDLAITYRNLGCALYVQYELTGESTDTDRAIAALRTSLSYFPDHHPQHPECLSNLALAYMRRFEIFNKLPDIDASIECARMAVSMITDDHPMRSEWLCQVGNSYTTRYETLGISKDLEFALSYHQEAVACFTREDRIRALCLDSLGTSLSYRFERQGQKADIDQSISCHAMAVQLILEGDPTLPERLNNLGNAYSRRFSSFSEPDDLDLSVGHLRDSVMLVDESNPYYVKWLENLSISLMIRFERLKSSEDLSLAIRCLQTATSLIPLDHSRRPNIIIHLASAYMISFNVFGSRQDLESSVEYYKLAALSSHGNAATLFHAATRWAMQSNHIDSLPCLEAYQQVMALVHRFIWLGVKMNEHFQKIPQVSRIVMEAVAVAVSLGEYDLALEWLEQGRSIMWNQMSQLRTPMDDLRRVHPELAGELDRVAQGLDDAYAPENRSGQHSPIRSTEQADQSHHRLAEQWESLLAQARLIPGFHDFMKPKTAKELMLVAQDRAIVVVVVEAHQCGALALVPGSQEIIYIPLPNLSHDKAIRAQIDLANSIQQASIRQRAIKGGKPLKENLFESILSMLWTDVAKPVLDSLGYTENPGEDLPHVTWCTTGPLAFLPLHAAGLYGVPGSRVSDFVVSSYTPTLTSLLSNLNAPNDFHGILAVGQTTTKGFPPLKGTIGELNSIANHAAASNITFTPLEDHLATTSSVSDQLAHHSWVHLACHGSQDKSDPTASAFHLHDGPLELGAIIRKPLPYARFAFLSACQTATGDESMPEESMHLAAGMIMAGYPSVIGTMWSIRDGDAPVVANRVYAELLKHGVPNSKGAARALHKAIEELRSKVGEKNFVAWVPYIHIGV